MKVLKNKEKPREVERNDNDNVDLQRDETKKKTRRVDGFLSAIHKRWV